MRYFSMHRRVDSGSTLLEQVSHDMVLLSTGEPLVDYENDDTNGEPFKGPLICKLDEEFIDGAMATFYENPALIATRQFLADLREIHIDNFEVHEVVIHDEVNHRTIEDYVLLNVLGSVSCADMEASDVAVLGDDAADDANVIDALVIDPSRIPEDREFFLAAEDTDCILVSERVVEHLRRKGYDDIVFSEAKRRTP